MKRMFELRAEQLRRFPDGASVSMWAIARYLDPQEAAEEAKRVKAEPYDRLGRELYAQLSPYSADSVWSAAWGHEIMGQMDQSRSIIERYRSFGLDENESAAD